MMKVLENIETIELNPDKISMFFFTAKWCGFCDTLKPQIEIVDDDMLDMYIIDVDKNKEFCDRVHLPMLPTIHFIKNNSLATILEGNQSKERIVEEIEKLKK